MNTKESARTRSEVTKFFVLFLTFSLLLILPGLNGFSEEPVNFPDENLEEAIRDAIGKQSGDIYPSDLEGLEGLDAPDNGITNLEGVQHCVDLKELDLGKYDTSNNISDISALSELTNLRDLNLGGNEITDISPLSELTNLQWLWLPDNNISDISALSELTNLRDLYLGGNEITDISPLSELTNIGNSNTASSQDTQRASFTSTGVGSRKENRFASMDERMQKGLREVDLASSSETFYPDLNLSNNEITNIQPLVDNDGLDSGDQIDLRENYLAPFEGSENMKNIQTLIDRGATVKYEPQESTIELTEFVLQTAEPGIGEEVNLEYTLKNISDKVTSGQSVRIIIKNPSDDTVADKPLENVPKLNPDDTYTNQYSFTPSTKGEYTAKLEIKGGVETATITVPVGQEPVNFPDENLEQAIREAIDKPSGEIYPSDLEGLTELRVWDAGINELRGIEHCEDLAKLDLYNNNISDLSPLSSLTSLEILDLSANNITDISSMPDLTNLQRLSLGKNEISDISSLSNLTNLQLLTLGQNNISDITALSNLTNLQRLDLQGNSISNILPLSNLSNLQSLSLWHNKITDISSLSDLTNLQGLYLGNNNISDISSLSNLTNIGGSNTATGQGEELYATTGPGSQMEKGSAPMEEKTQSNLSQNEPQIVPPPPPTDLGLQNNEITNIQPLVDNSGINSGDKVYLQENYLDTSESSEDMKNIQTLIDRGADVEYEPQKEVNFWPHFSYTLKNLNPTDDTYSLSLQAKVGEDAPPIEDITFDWSFGDGSEATGQNVTHTFDGLGKTYYVTLEATAYGNTEKETMPVMGLGGLSYLLNESLSQSDNTKLKDLESSLSWSENSLERIYLASIKAALKVYSLAEEYGLVSATQMTDAVGKAYDQTIPVNTDKLGLDQLSDPASLFELEDDNPDKLLDQLPGFKLLFEKQSGTESQAEPRAAETVASLTLPELYNQMEELATFTEGILDELAPVVNDEDFELQIPTCQNCTPEKYVSFDNGEVAAVMAYIASYKAGTEALISYTPGEPVMNNVTINIDKYGGTSLEGTDAVADIIQDNFLSARGNGVLDLSGDGDGDSEEGFEVLPDSSLTLRDSSLLESARKNLLRAVGWLKVEINDMPTEPGRHDPPISWPVELELPWSKGLVAVNKSDLLGLLNDLEGSLKKSTEVEFDLDFDGEQEYTTKLNLASLANDPIDDLKTKLPDLVTTESSTDPLIVIRDYADGINSNWKIDGKLDYEEESLSLNLPDPTLGGTLPEGDLNELMGLLVFGSLPDVSRPDTKIPAGWNIISPPGRPPNPGPKAALGDDIKPLNLYYNYAPDKGYTVYPDDTKKTQLHWDQGYWTFLSEKSQAKMAVNVPSRDSKCRFTAEGWKLIGVPYSADWSRADFSAPKDFSTDGAGNVRLVSWDPTEGLYLNHYSDSSYVLDPWRGYWVYVEEASPSDPASFTVSKSPDPPPPPGTQSPLPQSVDPNQLDYPPVPSAEVDHVRTTAYPNPVIEKKEVTFSIQATDVERAKVTIMNSAGIEVYSSGYESGNELTWDLQSSGGRTVSNGVYLYRVMVKLENQQEMASEVRRLLVLK